MAKWCDQGIIIQLIRQGETGLVVTLFTIDHGLSKGWCVRQKRKVSDYQIGNVVNVEWQARLEQHMGRFRCELAGSYVPYFFSDFMKLSAVSSASSLLSTCLVERHAYQKLYNSFISFLESLKTDHWVVCYLNFELHLLAELGYGLDLSQCAVSGQKSNLTHISPKTGRAVCFEAAQPYKDKLFLMPKVFQDDMSDSSNIIEAYDALKILGYFLDKYLYGPFGRKFPDVRSRLLDQFRLAA